jgi:hypothetical protein
LERRFPALRLKPCQAFSEGLAVFFGVPADIRRMYIAAPDGSGLKPVKSFFRISAVSKKQHDPDFSL